MKHLHRLCSIILTIMLLVASISSASANAGADPSNESTGIVEQYTEATETAETATPTTADEPLAPPMLEDVNPDEVNPDNDITQPATDDPMIKIWPDGTVTKGDVVPLMGIMPLASVGTWTQYGRSDHASAGGDSVSFSGHPMDPFTTLLFNAASDGDYRYLTFHLTEGNSDWHTLEGTGFMFNCGISGGMLNGYAVLFTQSSAGFYKLTNVNVSALASSHFTALPGVTLIDQKAKPAYSQGTTWYLQLIMSPGTLKVEKYSDTGFVQLAETIFTSTFNDKSGGTGYGPFGSFIAHDCPSISTSSLQYFNLTIKPNTPPVVYAPDVTLNRGASFSQMNGVTASDAEDGDLSSAVTIVSSNVNTQIPGVYQVVYTVADLAGASVNHTRKVTVLTDAVFVVTDIKTGSPIQGVGIAMSNPAPAPSDTDTKGESFIILPSGAYQWEISKQHPDYLPLIGKHSVQIDSASVSVWPLVIPIQLEKKYRDVGVTIELSSINGSAPKDGDSAKYNDVVVFKLTATNNGNQAVTPSYNLDVPDSLIGDSMATFGAPLNPGESASIELSFKVKSLAPTLDATLTATLATLILAEDGSTVADENATNNEDNASLTIVNIPVKLTKTDALSGKALAGVELRILSDGTSVKASALDDGTWVVSEDGKETLPTDKEGKVTIYGLAPGKYNIEETKTLPGYVLPNTMWAFERDENSETTGDTALKNEPTVFIITKTDAYTKKALEGVKFSVLGTDGKAIKLLKLDDGSYRLDEKGEDTASTDRDGKITVRYMPTGAYTVKELPIAGYSPIADVKVEIKDTHSTKAPATLVVENKPTKMVIEKYDATTKKPLGGAVFKLTDADGKPIPLVKLSDGIYRPDPKGEDTITLENGVASVLYLPIGKVTVEEVTPPTGYSTAKPVATEITAAHTISAPLIIKVDDKPIALKIRKITKDNQPLSGAGFAVKESGMFSKALTFSVDEKGVYRFDPNGKESTVHVNASGEALIYGLPVGEYVLEETVVPAGYIPATPQKIVLTADNDSDKPYEAVVVNEVFVQLGFDTDRAVPYVAAGLLMLSLIAGCWLVVTIRKENAETQL